ncbi:hypothetical protein HDU89_000493 [Geranomyces variabilis]|nr:hypothetical protein HDU89_000493 [Geranomyces variabilis]
MSSAARHSAATAATAAAQPSSSTPGVRNSAAAPPSPARGTASSAKPTASLSQSPASTTQATPPTHPSSGRKSNWNSSTSLKRSIGTKPNTIRPTLSHSSFLPPAASAAAAGSVATAAGSPAKLPSGRQKPTPSPLTARYESLLTSRCPTDSELREKLRTLRKLVLAEGLPPDPPGPRGPLECPLRGRVWKVLLGIYRVSATEYLGLIERGPCANYEKIKNDTFRTLATDKTFLATVDESMLSRLLNAFVWKMEDAPPSRLLNLTFTYVQGMNVLAAPFLYVMPELDAFYTFTAFVQHACPLYVQPALEGVHCGLRLLDRCLQVCDPVLFRHLKSKRLTATVYAFPSVMTFSACTPPLSHLLRLWDFLLCYGLHLNILCIVAQLLLIRAQLLASASPMKLLRTFPDLDARLVIKETLGLVSRLPEDLYDMLVRHPFDAAVYDIVMQGDEGEPRDAGEAFGF